MITTDDDEPNTHFSIFAAVFSVFTIHAWAVAKPVFDKFAGTPEYFVVNRIAATEIIIFVFILAIGIPLLVSIAIWVIHKINSRIGRVMTSVCTSIYLACYILQITRIIGLSNTFFVLGLALFAGIGIAVFTYLKNQFFSVTAYFFPIALIFPSLFLIDTNTRRVMFPPNPEQSALSNDEAGWVESRPPIIFVVLDELPLTNTLAPDGSIDKRYFPNLARLSNIATWYENGTTVHPYTIGSLTSILTGNRVPDSTLIPTHSYYPRNLFTLLQDHYAFHVVEEVTELLPPKGDSVQLSLDARLRKLAVFADDVMLVFAHMVLPERITQGLPAVDQSWGNFREASAPAQGIKQQAEDPSNTSEITKDVLDRQKSRNEVAKENRIDKFRTFIKSIEEYPDETLHFIHILLPHEPYVFLPSTRRYTNRNHIHGAHVRKPVWQSSDRAMVRLQQGEKIQAAAVDTLIGELLDELQSNGLFEKSMIILCADHGSVFQNGMSHRKPTSDSFGDVAFVPFMLKLPGQTTGGPEPLNAETIDILPTIYDIVGADADWTFDGRSLVSASPDDKTEKRIANLQGDFLTLNESQYTAARQHSLKRNIQIFGLDDPKADLFHYGEFLHLIGTPASALQRFAVEGKFNLWGFEEIRNVKLDAPFVPSRLIGEVLTPIRNPQDLYVAIVFNGKIEALVQPFKFEGKSLFDVVFEDSIVKTGSNDITLSLLDLDGVANADAR